MENLLKAKFGEDPFRARENDPGSGPFRGCAVHEEFYEEEW